MERRVIADDGDDGTNDYLKLRCPHEDPPAGGSVIPAI